MFAVMLNQPNASFEDMIMHGVTADNTTIQDKDYYKNINDVKNNEFFKGKDGSFDEVKFNNFYDSVVNAYNVFAKDDYEQKVIDSIVKDPLDWTEPFNTNIRDISAVITVGKGDFGHRAKGITGLGTIGDQVFSMREIAQDSRVRDENGNILDWSPNTRGFFKSIFDPTYVLATYDENGFHEENGQRVAHKKGEYKIDPETGDPFYEALGDRDPYGKEVLRIADTLTVDGTKLNKWDFLDSDGLTKSIGKTVLQTAVAIAPLFIPGADAILGTIGATLGLTSALPGLLKGVSNIFVDDDTPYIKALTRAESWIEKWRPTQSDASKGKFTTWENFGQIIRSSAWQLFSQKQVANLSRTLFKSGDALTNTKAGQSLALGYMALTSSTDSYSAFKEAGANDVVAGLGMLATMGALYELMNIDYFKDALFKGTWLDESEVNNVVKNYSKDAVTRLETAVGKSVKDIPAPSNPEQAKSLFNRIKTSVKNGWSKFTNSSLSGTPKDLTVPLEKAENGARKMLTNFNIILNRSVNEGVEESIEEVAQDLVKGVFAGLDALGIKSTEEEDSHLNFNWSPKEAIGRYLTSFGGGFLGGTVFAGFTQYQNRIKGITTIADFNNTSEQMLYLILNGQSEEIKDRAKMYRDKGLLGDKNLSIKNYTIDEKTGKAIFSPANGTDNQNDFSYELIVHEVDRIKKLLSDNGFTSKAIARWAMDFNGSVDNIKRLDNVLQQAIKKLRIHTTFMDDLVELAKKIVDVDDEIESLNPKPATDAEARIQKNEEEKDSLELKRLQKLKKDLLAQRDAFFNHENDREYIQQALFLANSELQKGMVTLVSDAGQAIDYDSALDILNGENGFFNYMLLRYQKKLNELGDFEKALYKKEYDEFIKNPQNINNIQQVGKFLFKLYQAINETLTPDLIEAEKILKDSKRNPQYIPGVHYDSPEYKQYITAKNIIFENNKKIEELTTKLSSIENTESEEYREVLLELTQNKQQLDTAQNIVARYEAMYDNQKDLFVEAQSVENNEIQDALIDLLFDIRDLNDALKKPDVDLDTIRAAMASKFSQALKVSLDYFTKLKNENMVSRSSTDLLFNRVLSFASEVFASISESELIDDKNGVSPIMDLILNGYDYDNYEIFNYFHVFPTKLLETLESGDINSIIGVFNEFKKTLKDCVYWPEDLSEEQIDKKIEEAVDAFQKYIFGDNLVDFIKKADNIIKSTKQYGLSDILGKINIAIGDDVKPFLQFIEEQKNSLLKQSKIEDFLLEPNAESVLNKIASLLQLVFPAIQSAYDGTNHAINTLPKSEKDITLAEISENTKLRLGEDYIYLLNVINTLLTINAKNKAFKNGYSQASEVTFHRNFMSELLNGTKDNEATWIGKFYKWFNVDIEDLWRQAGEQTGKTINLPTTREEDYADFKERFVRFWSLVRNAIFENHVDAEGKRIPISLKEIGELLGSGLTESDLRLNRYGEINAGQYKTDVSKNRLTSLGNTVVIAALLNEDYEQWYKEYISSSDDEDYPYIELMQQEIATMIGFQFGIAEDSESSIFSGILQAIEDSKVSITGKEQDEIDFINSIPVLKNLFYTDGGTGSGKSTATAFLVYKMLKKRAERNGKKIEVLMFVPTEKQMNGESGLFKSPDIKVGRHVDLMSSIGGDVDGALIYNGDLSPIGDTEGESKIRTSAVFVGNSNGVWTTRIKDNVDPNGEVISEKMFSDTDTIKYIFVDEAQHLNCGSLTLLDRWAKKNGIKVFLYGDKNQNGAQVVKDKDSDEDNISSVITLSTPTLGESLRFENAAQQLNYKELKSILDTIQDSVSKKHATKNSEISEIAKNTIDDLIKNKLQPILQYYEQDSVFVGTREIDQKDIDKYIEKFKRLSRASGKEVSDVCVIVEKPEDKLKYLSTGVTVLTEEEVLTAKEVQGNQYDFVIVDKSFNKDNLFLGYKDLYTLIGRAKIGSVVAYQLNTLQLNSIVGDKGLINSTNTESDFKEFGEWKSKVFDRFRDKSEVKEEKKSEEEEKEEKEDESKKKTPVVLKPEDQSDGLSDIFDEAPIDATNVNIESKEIETKEVSLETKSFFDSVDKTRERIKKDINESENPTFSYDWNDYVSWVESDGLFESEGYIKSSNKSIKTISLLSELDDFGNDSIKRDLRLFFRKFASAVVYNMQIQGHHTTTLKELVPKSIDVEQLVNNWNSELSSGNHSFISAFDSAKNKSAIYWKTTYKGKVKYIPIAIINGKIQGVTTVNGKTNIFEKDVDIWALRSNPGDKDTIPLNKRDTTVGIASKPRILAVDIEKINIDTSKSKENLGISADQTKSWFTTNNGHSFSLLTDCEILQDEDFSQIFKIKQQEGTTLYGFNVNSLDNGNTPDGTDSSKLAAHQKNVVATVKIHGAKVPVVAINTHKYVTLSTLYNLANIGRYAAGQITVKGLTEEQKKLLGISNNVENKAAAVAYVKQYLGEFNIAIVNSSMTVDEQAQQAENKRKLAYDYKLLSPKASYSILGACTAAINSLGEEAKDRFYTNILKSISTKSVTVSRSNITYKHGLYLNVYQKGRPTSIFISLNQDEGSGKVTAKLSLIVGKGRSFELKKKDQPDVEGVLDLGKISTITFNDIVKKVLDKLEIKLDPELNIDTALFTGIIQLSLMQRMTHPDWGKEPKFKLNDDYNLITTIFGGFREDPEFISKIEEKLHDYNEFKDGITLNENRKLSDPDEKARVESNWAKTREINPDFIRSNLRRIEGSIYRLITINGNPIFDGKDPGIVFNYDEHTEETIEESQFKFISKNPTWNGSKLICNAKVDSNWLEKFTEEKTFKNSLQNIVTSATVNTIDFTTGVIELTIGASKIKATLSKNEFNEFYSVEELSNNTVSNNNLPTVDGVAIKVSNGNVYSGEKLFVPLYKIGGLTYYVSSDGNIIRMSEDAQKTFGITSNVKEVINIGKDLFVEKGERIFYTSTRKLGKLNDYSNNFLIFDDENRLDYDLFNEDYIPQDLKNKRNQDILNPIKLHKFVYPPTSRILKEPYVSKVGNVFTLYGNTWTVNGAWLYNNTDFNDADEKEVSIIKIELNDNSAFITTDKGNTYKLNSLSSIDWLNNIPIDGDFKYLNDFMKKELNLNINDLNITGSSIEELIDKLNEKLKDEGKTIEFDSQSCKISITQEPEWVIALKKYASDREIKIQEFNSVGNDPVSISYAVCTKDDETFGLYYQNDKIVEFINPIEFIKKIEEFKRITNEDDIPKDSIVLQLVDNFNLSVANDEKTINSLDNAFSDMDIDIGANAYEAWEEIRKYLYQFNKNFKDAPLRCNF